MQVIYEGMTSPENAIREPLIVKMDKKWQGKDTGHGHLGAAHALCAHQSLCKRHQDCGVHHTGPHITAFQEMGMFQSL